MEPLTTQELARMDDGWNVTCAEPGCRAMMRLGRCDKGEAVLKLAAAGWGQARYGVAVVEDRGGAIKGERLDLWMPSVPQALAWGRRRVRVVVLE